MRLLIVLMLAVGSVFANPLNVPRVADAQDGYDEEAAVEAAHEISRLEADGNYYALYDLLHPDAQAIVPRAVVVGWYHDEMAGKTTEELTVTGVEFVDWTWKVTGTTYTDTAEVSFVQSYWVDGEQTDIEDVLRLVESDGQWRWFFGRSREFVDEQIALYGGSTALAPEADAYELFVVGVVCDTEPPKPPTFDDSDCRPAAGAAFEVRSADGEVIGSCMAEADDYPHTASCSVLVPYSSSGTVAEDESTVPEGYAPPRNPIKWWSPEPGPSIGVDGGPVFLNYPGGVAGQSASRPSADVNRGSTSQSACELVELYPGYPGYRGYVTGVDGVGDHACVRDLEAQQPGFSKAEQDRLNLAAAGRLALNGSPELWTWENWMAVEAERGLPPTCYFCALKAADARPAPTGTPVRPDDPRLLLDSHQPSPIIARYEQEHGVSLSAFEPATDFDFRAIAGMASGGRHLNAEETIAVMEQLVGYWSGVERGEDGSSRYMDTNVLWQNLLDQGGYVPTPATATLDDQVLAVGAGALAMRILMWDQDHEALLQRVGNGADAWRLERLSGATSLGFGPWYRDQESAGTNASTVLPSAPLRTVGLVMLSRDRPTQRPASNPTHAPRAIPRAWKR